MRMLRSTMALAAVAFAASIGPAVAQAQTKITVGKITSGSGFHIPSYIAMDQGFYKAEGLDASFITLPGRAKELKIMAKVPILCNDYGFVSAHRRSGPLRRARWCSGVVGTRSIGERGAHAWPAQHARQVSSTARR